MKKKQIVKQRKLKSGYGSQREPDTKTNIPTDRQSQYSLNLNYELAESSFLRRQSKEWKCNCER
jgi:hypothetical protein